MNLFMSAALGVFMVASTIPVATAQATESCGDILRYAARDVRKTVTFSDLRLFYFKKVCSADESGFGISYGAASAALGLNFTSKSDYCKAEEAATKDLKYSTEESSVVVLNSLDAYVACRALSEKGVDMSVVLPPAEAPTVFSITAQRRSVSPQSVDSLLIDPEAVTCNSQKGGVAQTLDAKFNVIGYEFPPADVKWSLVCSRKAIVDAAGNKTYPPTQLILTTSAGSLPVNFPASGYAAGAWVSELRGEAAAQAKKIAALEGQYANQKLSVLCGGAGWFPRPGAPACPTGYKDSGQFTFSAPGGSSGFGGHCRVCLGN